METGINMKDAATAISAYFPFYVLGSLISICVMLFWFFTGLPLHLTKILLPKRIRCQLTDWATWIEWVKGRSSLIGELFGCPICLGFWISVCVSSIIAWFCSLTPTFILCSAFSWPVFVFAAFRILSR